jgi:hypothetical protein
MKSATLSIVKQRCPARSSRRSSPDPSVSVCVTRAIRRRWAIHFGLLGLLGLAIAAHALAIKTQPERPFDLRFFVVALEADAAVAYAVVTTVALALVATRRGALFAVHVVGGVLVLGVWGLLRASDEADGRRYDQEMRKEEARRAEETRERETRRAEETRLREEEARRARALRAEVDASVHIVRFEVHLERDVYSFSEWRSFIASLTLENRGSSPVELDGTVVEGIPMPGADADKTVRAWLHGPIIRPGERADVKAGDRLAPAGVDLARMAWQVKFYIEEPLSLRGPWLFCDPAVREPDRDCTRIDPPTVLSEVVRTHP